MTKAYFQNIEHCTDDYRIPFSDVLANLNFNQQGLIPVIAQDATSKEVLMQAWMNAEALTKTLDTGRMVYWSRSRNAFWEKGATSGHSQTLVSMAD